MLNTVTSCRLLLEQWRILMGDWKRIPVNQEKNAAKNIKKITNGDDHLSLDGAGLFWRWEDRIYRSQYGAMSYKDFGSVKAAKAVFEMISETQS